MPPPRKDGAQKVNPRLKVDVVSEDDAEGGEAPRLSNPIVICGLPGSALVGKLAVDHLVEELEAQQLAQVYVDGLAPQVFIESDGTASALNNDLFLWKSKAEGVPDLILYTADAQPTVQEAEYALSEAVVDYLLKEFHVKQMITLGAFVTGKFPKEPKVYVAATEEPLVKFAASRGCQVMTEGTITGMNGILLGIAKLKGIAGYSLLGETSGFALDPKASRALLVSLERIVGLKVDLTELDERAKEAESVLQSVEAMRKEQGERAEGEDVAATPSRQTESENERKRLGYIS